MEFRVISLPGHTRCCIGFYCEKEGLLLSNETLGVYDGDKTILPAFLVSFADTIKSIEKIEKLDIKYILAPHFGLLDEIQTEYFLKNMKSSAQNIADDILGSIRSECSDEETVAQFKNKYWYGNTKESYPEDAITLNTSIMVRLLRSELL